MHNTVITAGAQAAATAYAGTIGGQTLTSATGQLYVWVGGNVSPGAAQAAGAYTGTITIAVTQP